MKSVLEAKRMMRENLQDFNQNQQMRLMYDCIYVIYKDEIQSLKPVELWHKIGLDFPKLKIKKTNFIRTLWKYKRRTNEREKNEDNKKENTSKNEGNNKLDYTEKLREFLINMKFNEEQRTRIKELIKELPNEYEVYLNCIGAKHLSCIIEKK